MNYTDFEHDDVKEYRPRKKAHRKQDGPIPGINAQDVARPSLVTPLTGGPDMKTSEILDFSEGTDYYVSRR